MSCIGLVVSLIIMMQMMETVELNYSSEKLLVEQKIASQSHKEKKIRSNCLVRK